MKMESCLSTAISSSSTFSIFSTQGASSNVGRSFTRSCMHPQLLSCQLPKPFLQLNGRTKYLLNQRRSVYLSSGTYRGHIISAENQGWDLGRFLKTLYFFNGPPSPDKIVKFIIEKLSSSSPEEPEKKMETAGYVLVVGATGGVGRRVVENLRKKGLPVKALVRNEEKARKMLGPDIELIVGDITKASTLPAKYFKGVRKVINAASVIIGPKEGDTPERAKYSQGVKFFEPEIKGDSPELVEYIGMKNLINAVRENVGLRTGKLLFGFEGMVSKFLACGKLQFTTLPAVKLLEYIIFSFNLDQPNWL